MNKKQSELYKFLLNKDRAVTSNEISNALNISSRSVKNYVQEINNLYNKRIILASRNGYQINHLFSSYILFENETIPQTNEERTFYIIKSLILKPNQNMDIYELCDFLCISYSTIKSIISTMNKTYSTYKISFICKNDNIQIIGDEKDKRKLISYVINEESKNSFIDLSQISNCFNHVNIELLHETVISFFKDHNCYINDFAASNLLLHLAIMIDRQMSGYHLEVAAKENEISQKNEQLMISELCEILENKFHIQLNKYEKNEVNMLLNSNTNILISSVKDELKNVVGTEIINLVDYYVKQINILYMIDLSDDSFVAPFSLHLKNLLLRAKMNNFTHNPIAESVKLNNPIIFDIAIFVGLDLSERYSITLNEDELAFLAMHIGAEIERQNTNKSKTPAILLCPNYHNMCRDLLNKLLLNFGNQINIVRTISNEQQLIAVEEEFDSLDFKILFTVLPLKGPHNFTTISISPYSLNQQYNLIQEIISSNQNKYKYSEFKKNFHTFFEEKLFFYEDFKEKDEVISCICDKLKQLNYVDDNFKDNIYKRENAASTSFGNIAIPHSMEMDAVKTSIAVAISKKGIQWGTDTVHLVLLIAINKADKNVFRNLYESFISLFSESNMIFEIKKCNTFNKFKTLIYNEIDTIR